MKHTNSILIFERVATIWYIILVIANILFPVLNGKSLNINLFTILIIINWTIAILSAHGFFKKAISVTDEKIVYDTVLPIFPPTLVRIAEFGWMFFRHGEHFQYQVFFLDVFIDIVLIVLLLLDKSRYYYEAYPENEDDETDL